MGNEEMKIPAIKTEAGTIPEKQTHGAAAVDLRSTGKVIIPPGGRKLVMVGIKTAIPKGYCGLVIPRSGLAIKHGITVLNAPGLIDSDYRGEWGVILFNAGYDNYYAWKGDRIAQAMIVKAEEWAFQQVESLDETDRGEGGFGSTGK